MTDNPLSVAEQDTFTVRRTIRIAAPVEKVWRAVTEPEHISSWFGRTVLVGDGTGAHGTVAWPDEPAIPIRVEEVDPPRAISYRWCNDEATESVPSEVDPAHSTVFTFTLEPVVGGTQLTVVETGFETTTDPAGNLESHRLGWDEQLDRLVVALEAQR
ncbi:SRPBCC domain-containing protein [Promicromonospora panici]|uniref:SRPBCC domain-containing protein n=1 Tax=Promicromonospora panici TaxID=2219658 RepID=UPI00101CA132|nr:SRPBCC domain-containing protein [Promicromonospora panici]